MNRVTVDSSLAVKWFLNEAGVREAAHLLEKWSAGVEVWAPDLIWIECVNATRHKVEAQELPLAFAAQLLASFLNAGIHTVPCREVAASALVIALETGLTAWDACYVATAMVLGAELWTADRRMQSCGVRAYPNIQLLTWSVADEETEA